jgi:hypothetical protein
MDGVFGYSSIKSTGKEFFDRPDYKALGLSYLKKLDVDSLSLYKQEGRIEKKITKNSRERKILILGSHEMQCGMHPPESNDRKKVLPFFTGNEEMVIYLLQEIDNAIVIFKPHPHSDINLSELIDNKNFFVSNSNPNSLIAISDVVISNCSKLEMNVVAKNKPLVLPGFGLLWNKGCAYDAGSKAEFSELVSECLKKHSKADEFFDALTGYLGFIIKDQHFLGKFSFENNVSSEADDIKGFADYFLDRLELSRYGNGKIELSAHVFIRDQLLDNNFVYSSLKDLFRVEVPNIYRFMTFFSPKRYFLKIKKILNSLGGL